jgi:hypothetical protein
MATLKVHISFHSHPSNGGKGGKWDAHSNKQQQHAEAVFSQRESVSSCCYRFQDLFLSFFLSFFLFLHRCIFDFILFQPAAGVRVLRQEISQCLQPFLPLANVLIHRSLLPTLSAEPGRGGEEGLDVRAIELCIHIRMASAVPTVSAAI